MNQRTFVLCLALCCHFVALTSSQDNDKNAVDNKNVGININSTPLPIHKTRQDDVRIFSSDAYDYQEHGRLTVEVKEITSSTINVKWSLPERKFNDSVLESTIVCETSSGLMISKTNATSRATYRLENLHADTSYFVCVYMLEKSHFSNTKVLHYSCHTLKTLERYNASYTNAAQRSDEEIPSLRTDSIVAVVITLGYITVMVIIGYLTWRWKKKLKEQDEAKQKLAIEEDGEDDYDEDDGMINGHLRDNSKPRGSDNVGSGAMPQAYRGDGGSGYFHSGSWSDFEGQKDRDSMRSSSRGLNNSDRVRGGGGGDGSRSNNIHTVAVSESDGCLQRTDANSTEEANGCLDFKRSNRGSGYKLNDFTTGNGSAQERSRPKSQSVEDSPVKVTEISF